MRTILFNLFDKICYGNCWMKVYENMYVILDAVNSNKKTFLICDDAVDVGEEFTSIFFDKNRFAVFGCKYDMVD